MTYIIEKSIEVGDSEQCEVQSSYRGRRLTVTLDNRSFIFEVDSPAQTARLVEDTHYSSPRPGEIPSPVVDYVLALGLRLQGPSVGQRDGFDDGYALWVGNSR